MEITIDSRFDGRTVKDWLYQNGVSRALITRLKKSEDGITVNGSRVTVRYVLRAGDILSLGIADSRDDVNDLLAATEMPLDIIYEDGRMIAVNKPAGIPTHPSHGHFDDTLANGLKFLFDRRGLPFVFRAVNRLDRDTSGIVLAAKDQYSASLLTGLMRAGRIRKTYIAFLNGIPEPRSGVIDRPIRRARETIILRETCDISAPGAKEALTEYETLAVGEDCSMVRAEPITGRTHQLRVHFSDIGTPIAGDGLYGSAESSPTPLDLRLTRHALHAAGLKIETDSGTIELSAPLPEDMETIRTSLFNN